MVILLLQICVEKKHFCWHDSCVGTDMKKEFSNVSRRDILGMLTASAAAVTASRAFAAPLSAVQPDLRGTIDAVQYRAIPESGDKKNRNLQQMIEKAARENVPVFLPAGTYRISNLTLPDNTRITGVPGATRIVYTGEG